MSMLITGTFIVPHAIGVNTAGFLWLLPLATAIAVVYKALKTKEITPVKFAVQSLVLTGTILFFMAIVAAGLYGIAWIITE